MAIAPRQIALLAGEWTLRHYGALIGPTDCKRDKPSVQRRPSFALMGAAAAVALVAAALEAKILVFDPPAKDRENRLHADWAGLAHYREANKALMASGARVDVVFLGDSITELWRTNDPVYFRDGLVDRGISKQTSPQMLVRFRQDVIDLRPRAVHIMMGTNDIQGNTGPMSAEDTEANFETMSELARSHHIGVILASIPPAAHFSWLPGLKTVEKIRALNTWIRAYAARTGATYADYTSVLDDGAGGMKAGLAVDEVHPTPQGYELMGKVADTAIADALRRSAP